MARSELRDLYRELVDQEFAFAPRGTHHVHTIYAEVRRRHPKLCDDLYLCRHNCTGGHNQPEWQHTTRKALERLKGQSVRVAKAQAHGFWRLA